MPLLETNFVFICVDNQFSIRKINCLFTIIFFALCWRKLLISITKNIYLYQYFVVYLKNQFPFRWWKSKVYAWFIWVCVCERVYVCVLLFCTIIYSWLLFLSHGIAAKNAFPVHISWTFGRIHTHIRVLGSLHECEYRTC